MSNNNALLQTAKDYREFSAMMRDSERAFRSCLT